MSIDIKVPVLPESVSDATVATWHKKPGDKIMRDESLVDIETDKVVLEVVAPADGTIEKIICDTGATVQAEQVIGLFAEGAVPGADTEKPSAVALEPTIPAPAMTASSIDANPTLSPAVRRVIGEQDLDPRQITGTGKDNRITMQDVQSQADALTIASTRPVTASGTSTQVFTDMSNGREEKRVPMTRLRAKIAERLLAAQHNAAILTTFNEIDMAPVMALRSKYKDEFQKKYNVKLGFMSFFVNAAVAALKEFPAVNASIDGNDLVYHGYFDIGIAVSTERGLVVPVVRDADTLSMAEIERKIIEYGKAASEGKLAMEDMTGGTFTITNGGVFGSLMATPIINPPQSGILGMHKIMERPVVVDKQIVIRPMMYVALSYDHRIIDGKDSVQFLRTIKEMLEDPARLALNI